MDVLSADISLYVRLLTGMVLGIALGKTLTGVGYAIQRKHIKPDIALQALWAVFVFGSIIDFWWQEANTFGQVAWTYHLYLFQILNCCIYLAVAVLLFPAELDEYDSYGDYLLERRHWVIGALIVSYAFEYVDTFVKRGAEAFSADASTWYVDLILLVPLAFAIVSRSLRVQYWVAGILATVTVLVVLLPE